MSSLRRSGDAQKRRKPPPMSDALTPREVIARALATWFGKPWPRRKSNRETYLGGADIVPSALKDNGMAVVNLNDLKACLKEIDNEGDDFDRGFLAGFEVAIEIVEFPSPNKPAYKPKRRGR